MSVVTNVILTCSGLDEGLIIGTISRWLQYQDRQPLRQVDQYWYGHKGMEMPVYIGAYNYFTPSALSAFLGLQLNWELPLKMMMISRTDEENPRVSEFDIHHSEFCLCHEKLQIDKTRQICPRCEKIYWIRWISSTEYQILRFDEEF